MPTGQTTEHFDVAFIAINAFFLFFFGLIYYLRREDKREGYPLVEEGAGRLSDGIFPATPAKKTFLLQDGTTLTLPREPAERKLALKQVRGPSEGSPFVPTGNPLVDAVGPASYAQREDHPDMTWEGEARIVPLRVATDFWIAEGDPDVRGWDVVAADGKVAGTVKEAWIDRAEPQVFYYEVAIPSGIVLLPARLALIDDSAKKVLVEIDHRGAVRRRAAAEEPRPDHPARGRQDLRLFRRRSSVCHAGPSGTDRLKEHEAEPVRGLPERLPAGESILWQGAPRWGALARRVFHVRKIALYFAILLAWLVTADVADGISPDATLRSSLWVIGAALLVVGLLSALAVLIERTSVYTITTRRVVMRVGMAFPIAFNLPFRRIRSAGLRVHADGSGDIPLALGDGDKLAYLALWPHARPWHLSAPEPMLRGLRDVRRVAEILARALSDDMQTRVPAAPAEAASAGPGLSGGAASDAAATPAPSSQAEAA